MAGGGPSYWEYFLKRLILSMVLALAVGFVLGAVAFDVYDGTLSFTDDNGDPRRIYTYSNGEQESTSPISAEEVVIATRTERDALLSKLVREAILYQVYDNFHKHQAEGYPSRTIDEIWSVMGPDASIAAQTIQSRDYSTGNPVLTSIRTKGDTYGFMDHISGATWGFAESDQSIMPVSNMWFMPLRVEKENFQVKGSGWLLGHPSTIFENHEIRLELELVNESPLLHRMSFYDEARSLTSELTLLEYEVFHP